MEETEVEGMTKVRISEKGQMTLPAAIRRKLGIAPGTDVELEVREGEVVVRPLKTISEVAGVFRRYTRGKAAGWETVRRETQDAVARDVADE